MLRSVRGGRKAATVAAAQVMRTAGVCRTTSIRSFSYTSNENATTFESPSNFGSYKNNIYTHRLPESTAEQSPDLVALRARLALPPQFSFSTLSQALNMEQKEGLANNFGLNTLGKSLLSYYVSEYLLVKYPRLPMPIHNQAVDAYMGVDSLHSIGKSWGIQADRNSSLEKYLAQEPFYVKYGKLRYLNESQRQAVKEEGVIELTDREAAAASANSATGGKYIPQESEAYASAVRAIVGGLYTHCGEETTKQFIKDHILSRKLPIDQMFQFSQPMRELVRLSEKLGFKEPVEVRLVAETGRLTSHPIFVTAVFVGTEKLGEGVGGSLAEAKTRAAVNSLMGYYLYSPMAAEGDAELKVPSDEGYKFQGVVGLGDVAI
ncbi:54S ribosomal protein L3, mitochondrial [[Candida] anglica]|uniref:Large ribosomal subunit protein mL44 n=1 Tax=[Candida] anglica TaxID=148631 RepID=A0ABP0E798_9ASCO